MIQVQYHYLALRRDSKLAALLQQHNEEDDDGKKT